MGRILKVSLKISARFYLLFDSELFQKRYFDTLSRYGVKKKAL